MKVSVWDTYVQRANGLLMHFDILVPSVIDNIDTVLGYGMDYLHAKSFETGKLTAKECHFCHMETAPLHVRDAIEKKGYFIVEMENCG
ncbi:MAG: DUF2024 family protein [Flavobacteriaceae bacterium]